MRSVLPLLAAAVLLSPFARADEATAWAEKAYAIDAIVDPGAVPQGQQAKVVVTIRPTAADAKVHPEAPIKVNLAPPASLKLSKEKLGRADGKAAGKSFRFEVPANAAAPGAGTVEAKVDFFICSERWCVRQQATAAAPVKVCAKDQPAC